MRSWFAGVGVAEGDTVVTMLEPSFEAYHAWLGLSALGAMEVPVNPQLRGRTLAYLIGHSQAAVAVVEARLLVAVAEVAESLQLLRTVVVIDADEDTDLVDAPFDVVRGPCFRANDLPVRARIAERHDTACVIYTSGTTGPPKGVVIPWGWLNQPEGYLPSRIDRGGSRYSCLARAHVREGRAEPGTRRRQAAGPAQQLQCACLLERHPRVRLPRVAAVPAVDQYLLAEPPRDDDRSVPLQHIWTAPLVPETRTFMDRFGVAVTTGFGSTEIGGPIARVDVDGQDLSSCGRQAVDPRGYEVRIVDEHDRELGSGEIGELVVRTSVPWTLNGGYFRDSEATAIAWRNGWFHTGDALKRDDEGNFYFVDRYKDCIRCKGENISSFEVEGYVLDHPGVAEAAAVGVMSDDGEPDNSRGTQLKLLKASGGSHSPAIRASANVRKIRINWSGGRI